MNIEDLNIILQDELFERINYSFKKPYAASVNKNLFVKLKQKYPELSYSEMSYLYLHKDNLQDLHIFCPVCGKKNKFIDTTEGYRHHCSYKCRANDVTVIDKIISSAKNNVDSSGLNSYQRASIKTKHTRYNDLDDNGFNSYERANLKVHNTKLSRYGNENYNNRYKSKQTLLNRYGVDNARNIPGYQDKRIKHDLAKYGVPYYTNRDKAVDTCIKNNSYLSRSIKTRQYFLDKYNTTHPTKIHIVHKENLNKEYIEHNFIKDGCFDIDSCCKYFNVSISFVYNKIKEFNIDKSIFNKSIKQVELFNFVKDIYHGEIIFNDRTTIYPLELDIYVPEAKVAIEYNGMYWHCINRGIDKKYHQNKSLICRDKCIRLIHVYEDEWTDSHKQIIIKDIIKHALNIPTIENRVYARKCVIKEIQNSEYKDFCNTNHIQGFRPADIKLGLFYKDKLVQIASFNKSRYDKNYEYEWIRGCPASNNNVIGGTSKLFKYFVNNYNPSSVVCYADFNKFDGSGYKQCGFTFDKITVPDKFYYDPVSKVRINRNPNKYQEYKDKVINWDLLLIYGSGNIKFIWHK